jgi:hypothetical protein
VNDKQYQDLIVRLDRITRLLSIIALKGSEREQDKIELLDMTGFRPSEIARLLNKSPQNISVVLGNLRKKKGQNPEHTPNAVTPEEIKPVQTTLPPEAK